MWKPTTRVLVLETIPTLTSKLFSAAQCLQYHTKSSRTAASPRIIMGTDPVTARTTPQAGVSMRLMPLGGSLTFGQGSTDGNGYRSRLREMLLADGIDVDMVGSRKVGLMSDNDNEGWRGFRIDQIDQRARKSVPYHLPNVYTVNAGSNDCLQDFKLDQIGDRMGRMLDYLWAATPEATIILSTLLVNSDKRTEERVLVANEQFQKLARRRITESQRIVTVDMHGLSGPQLHELSDGTHPTDEGYEKMAAMWHKGIREAVQKGFV